MKKEVKKVTVKEAKALLKGHVNQRELSNKMVAEMVNDINKSTFNKDDANVCLYEDGKLFYGQHILNAIIQVNKELELNVYTLEIPGDEKEKGRPGRLNVRSKYKYNPKRPHTRERLREGFLKNFKARTHKQEPAEAATETKK